MTTRLVKELFNSIHITGLCDMRYDSNQLKVYSGLIEYFKKHNKQSCKIKEKSIVNEDGEVLFKITNENYKDLSFSSNMDILCMIEHDCISLDYVNKMGLHEVKKMIDMIEDDEVTCDENKSIYLMALKLTKIRDYSVKHYVEKDNIRIEYISCSMNFSITIKNTYCCSLSKLNVDYALWVSTHVNIKKCDDISYDICDILSNNIIINLNLKQLLEIGNAIKNHFKYIKNIELNEVDIKTMSYVKSKLPPHEKIWYSLVIFVKNVQTSILEIETRDSIIYSYTINCC